MKRINTEHVATLILNKRVVIENNCKNRKGKKGLIEIGKRGYEKGWNQREYVVERCTVANCGAAEL